MGGVSSFRDEMPPVTVITSAVRDGNLVQVRGSVADTSDIKRVTVNDRSARSTLASFAEWEIFLDIPADQPVSLTAVSEDIVGHVEQTPHVVTIAPLTSPTPQSITSGSNTLSQKQSYRARFDPGLKVPAKSGPHGWPLMIRGTVSPPTFVSSLVHRTWVACDPGLPVRSNPSILRPLGTEPAFRDHFLSRVESNGISTLRIEITVNRILPAAERKEPHRRRHADIDAEHPGLDAFAEDAGRRPGLREEASRVAVSAAVCQRDRRVQVRGASRSPPGQKSPPGRRTSPVSHRRRPSAR